MNTLTLLVSLGLLATIAMLAMGLGSMSAGGEYDRQHSVGLMFARVAVQAVTVLLVLLAVLYPFVR